MELYRKKYEKYKLEKSKAVDTEDAGKIHWKSHQKRPSEFAITQNHLLLSMEW